jgi:2TM domain
MEPMTEEEMRQTAERRAHAKLGFRSHLIVYVIVVLGLVVINLGTSPHYLWFLWAAAGWGIGLVAHGAAVYLDNGALRERMVARELERLRAQARDRR